MVRKHAKVIAEDTKIAKVRKAHTHTLQRSTILMWDGVSMACSYTLQSVHYIVSNSSVQLCYSGIALALASASVLGQITKTTV